MNNNAEQAEVEAVTCHVCQQDVPHTQGLTVEAQEYLFFFCGQGCYESWQQMNGLRTADVG